MLIDTRDVMIGCRIDTPHRGLIVYGNDPSGISVLWFDRQGRGPHFATLPHTKLFGRIYHDERNGEHQSYHDTHPDFTGKTGEV
jgi:hypothetical protein